MTALLSQPPERKERVFNCAHGPEFVWYRFDGEIQIEVAGKLVQSRWLGICVDCLTAFDDPLNAVTVVATWIPPEAKAK